MSSHYEKLDGIERCIDDEIPFETPDNWEWCRLNNIVIKSIKRGKSPKYAEHSHSLVFAQKCNTKKGTIDLSLSKYLDESTLVKYPTDEYLIAEDIIVNSTGHGTLGRIGIFNDSDRINDFIVVPDSHVTIVRCSNLIYKKYMFYFLKHHQPYIEKMGEGSTNQTELKPAIIENVLVPLPPLSEQYRIVEKIEQLINATNKL